jgi:hypothetical protein
MMRMVRTRTSFIEVAAPARLLAMIIAGTCLPCAGSARAQTFESSWAVMDEPMGSPQPIGAPDYLFAPAGTFSITLASGIPLLGIGELTYSPTDRFAMGAVVAGTPDLPAVQGTAAIGLRPRGVVLVEGSWRSVLVVPILSYPKVPGFGDRDPWILARPTLTLEKTRIRGAAERRGRPYRRRVHREPFHARSGTHDDGGCLEHGKPRRRRPDLGAHESFRRGIAHHARRRPRERLDRRRPNRRVGGDRYESLGLGAHPHARLPSKPSS